MKSKTNIKKKRNLLKFETLFSVFPSLFYVTITILCDVFDSPRLILVTAGFSEVCDGGELGVDGLPVKPAVVQVQHGLLCILLLAELRGTIAKRKVKEVRGGVNTSESGTLPHLHVNVSNQMVPEVVAHVHFFHFAILFLHFCEDLLRRFKKKTLPDKKAVYRVSRKAGNKTGPSATPLC